jgi:purine nucleoside phosphorylase
MLAVIGGSGLTRMSDLEGTRSQAVRTPYGDPSDAITHGTIRGRAVMFLARHGSGHTIPPHEINYRANLWALKEAGADRIVAVATYFEGGDVPVTHVDFTHPYTEGLRRQILDAARGAGEAILDGGVYAATQGPRLESAAEIDRFERDGADLVGMTGMPEAALARELEIEYAAIAVVVNHAAGRGDSKYGIAMDRIEATLQQSIGRARRVIEELVAPA